MDHDERHDAHEGHQLRSETTRLLEAVAAGEGSALDQLFARVYDELRALARKQRAARGNTTLDTTSLVHEAYLKLVDAERVSPVDRHHFISLAARAMRQIVLDHARRRASLKRGGGGAHSPLETRDVPVPARGVDWIALDRAMERLGSLDPRLGRIVELRFFAGCTTEEIGEVLDLSGRTVKREWRKARAFLHRELDSVGPTPENAR